LTPKLSNKILGRAVMVSQVPGGEAGVMIVRHILECGLRIDTPMRPGYLPHTVQEAADAHIRSELKLACWW
jgi:hypothetical protein